MKPISELSQFLARLRLPQLGQTITRNDIQLLCIAVNYHDEMSLRSTDAHLRLNSYVRPVTNVEFGYVDTPAVFQEFTRYRVAAIESTWFFPNKHIHFVRHVILSDVFDVKHPHYRLVANKYQETFG